MKTFFFALAVLLCLSLPALADMPKEGQPAPGFTLLNQDGKKTSLDDFKGKWVVLYFYPKDFTKGCSTEAHNFKEDLKKYTDKGATIVGVSVDAPDSHKGFCAKEGLNFTLLADTDHKAITLYDSSMTIPLIGTVAARNTFLIDPKGVIRKVYVKVDPETHSAAVLADLATLQAPAK